MPEPLIGQAFTFSVDLEDAANPGIFLANPPLASGDVLVSKDWGAWTTIATLPTVPQAGTSTVRVSLSGAEMTVSEAVDLRFHDADGAWRDLRVTLYPTVAGLDIIAQDTNDLQTRLPATLIDGRIDSHVGAVAAGILTAAAFASDAFDAVWNVTSRLLTAGTNIVLAKGTGVTGFNDISQAQVNAEVVDVIRTDTQAELVAVPTANAPLSRKIDWLFMLARNKMLQTATTFTLRNDTDSADVGIGTVSDDGTVFVRDKLS
jgi:hypothetical protein